MLSLTTCDLGEAWASNSVNCVPFRVDAMVTLSDRRLVTFYDAEGHVSVCEVGRDGTLLSKTVVPSPRAPLDAHQSISMGITTEGQIHLAFGAHGQSILCCRSIGEGVSAGFTPVVEESTRATYPMFVNGMDGSFLRLYRVGHAQAGDILVDRWTGDTWRTDPHPFVAGTAGAHQVGPYLHRPALCGDGRIAWFLVWRIGNALVGTDDIVNSGIDCFVTNRLGECRTAGGVALRSPVCPQNAERVVAVPLGSSLMNQCSACWIGGRMPAAISYWDSVGSGIPQFHLCWFAEGVWRTSQASAFTTPFKLRGGGTLAVPHSRPEILARTDGRVLVLYRSAERAGRLCAIELEGPDYSLGDAREHILVDEDLGYYEPVVDHSAWRTSEEVVLYVQPCQQETDSDGQDRRAASPARVMTWKWL